jgi:hypothetical protein
VGSWIAGFRVGWLIVFYWLKSMFSLLVFLILCLSEYRFHFVCSITYIAVPYIYTLIAMYRVHYYGFGMTFTSVRTPFNYFELKSNTLRAIVFHKLRFD